MAAGAWDHTSAILEFVAAHGGVKISRKKLNPYRGGDQESGLAELVSIGKAAVVERQKQSYEVPVVLAERMNGSR